MSTRIPLPGNMIDTLMKGLDTGSTLYSRAMQPILDREHQEQAEKHFKEQMALRKAAFARSGQNADIQRQLLEQQLLGLKHKNDPMYELNQFAALQNMLTGGGGGAMPGQQQPAPTQERGEGMGMFSPEGMQEAQKAPMAPPQGGQGGGINLDAMRNNPLLRGFFKHKFGIDPLAPAAQTPDEKQASALDLFREKEKIKAASKSGDTATNKVLTQNQQAVQAIDTVVPMIDEFINKPDLVYGEYDFSPSKKAAYEAKTGGMIDMLVAAQSLPQVKESVKLVEDQIRRRTNESKDAYIKRLKDFKKDLMTRRTKSAAVVNSKKVNTSPSEDYSHMSDDELRAIAGGG